MYQYCIELLKNKNIRCEKGLSEAEIEKVYKTYNITFPVCYENFLKEILPVSDAVYNWRDFSGTNVKYIKESMRQPFDDIEEMSSEVYWCDEWGEEPDEAQRIVIIRERLKKAPKLIPIYHHRYMPIIDSDNPPVLSIHGVDVIYYGKNLEDYIQNEFGSGRRTLFLNQYKYVPFWSDIM